MNHYTLAFVAMSGKNYCKSAKESYFVIMRNSLDFIYCMNIGRIMVIFTQMFVCFLTTIIGYQILVNHP